MYAWVCANTCGWLCYTYECEAKDIHIFQYSKVVMRNCVQTYINKYNTVVKQKGIIQCEH